MKKATMETIYNALLDNGYESTDPIMEELAKEMNKGQARKDANAKAYDEMHDIIINALTDTPATCAEIFESIETDLPAGTTKAKVQYALTHLWQDEIVKVEGKPNSYRKA